ncbi:MAG: Deblocking aminopeptidase [Anaerolineae bacterium]|nr:MAG: Deblocking aminopeptidase [Anaerolineae bacterium]
MTTLPAIDSEYLLNVLSRLLNIPSPTGFAQRAIQYCEEVLSPFSTLKVRQNRKGALIAEWEGERTDSPRGVTAHVDTLGAMVKEIKANGRLKLTQLGGYPWNTVEGEGCTVFTREGKTVRGSLLITKASAHVYGKQVSELSREADNLEVRLDARTTNAEQTRALGIEVGDYVAFDPRLEITEGFVRSRHLDDKAGVACMLAAIKTLYDEGLRPRQTTTFLISNYEEVGHGAASGFPPQLAELLVVDMAAVGEGQTSDEFHVSLCVKDSGGPYHHEFSQKLRRIADQAAISYKVDTYPYYGSDGEAYWRAGGDVAVALIGPGVDASHNYERTHLEALLATTQWIVAYLLSE